MSRHITFYHYLIVDDKSEQYNPKLPFGGIKEDAPEKIKERYDEFVEEYRKCEEKLIADGETPDEAKRLVKKYFEWKRGQITKECSNSWKKHFKQKQKQIEVSV